MKIQLNKKISYKKILKLMTIGKLKELEFAENRAGEDEDQTIFAFKKKDIKLNIYLPTRKNDGCLYFLKDNIDQDNNDIVEIYFNFSTDKKFIITEVINFTMCSSFNYGNTTINLKD